MIEIERKFLVRNMGWRDTISSCRIEQGYLFINDDRNLRIRCIGAVYTLTLKVNGDGLARYEFETDIDAEQGQEMLRRQCVGRPIKKTRHVVEHADKIWEIDVFEGANFGLIVAEIELIAEDEAFKFPAWIGPEVTDDTRYFNAALTSFPFSEWGVSYADLLSSASQNITSST